jgi:hypothetical protein
MRSYPTMLLTPLTRPARRATAPSWPHRQVIPLNGPHRLVHLLAWPHRTASLLGWRHHPARLNQLAIPLAGLHRRVTRLAWPQRAAGQQPLAGLHRVGVVLAQATAPPNPAPKAPPGLTQPVTMIIAWGKWGVLVCGMAGLLICAGKMAIGHRNRATFAADGATGVPWVLGGLSLAAIAASVAGVFLK